MVMKSYVYNAQIFTPGIAQYTYNYHEFAHHGAISIQELNSYELLITTWVESK